MVCRRSWLCVLAWLWCLSLAAVPPCSARIYTNHWAVRIPGGAAMAERIAEKYGYRNLGQVGPSFWPSYCFVVVVVVVVLFVYQPWEHNNNNNHHNVSAPRVSRAPHAATLRGQTSKVQTAAVNLEFVASAWLGREVQSSGGGGGWWWWWYNRCLLWSTRVLLLAALVGLRIFKGPGSGSGSGPSTLRRFQELLHQLLEDPGHNFCCCCC